MDKSKPISKKSPDPNGGVVAAAKGAKVRFGMGAIVLLMASAFAPSSDVQAWERGQLRRLLTGEGAPAASAQAAVASDKERIRVSSGGVERSSLLFTPPSYDSARPTPLVLVFHGGHGSGDRISEQTGFEALAAREGFLVAYPDAIGSGHWNDGRSSTAGAADDIAFVRRLIDTIAGIRNLDTSRIYATGHSNGGFFVQRLACELSDRLAAVASVNATMGKALASRCNPSAPISVMMINGTADRLVPWEGGEVQKGRFMGKGGAIVAVEETLDFWVRREGCRPTKQKQTLPDRDPNDGTRVERWEFDGCRAGNEVVLIRVVGGGHAWPGSRSSNRPALSRLVGTTSFDIDANQLIWSFFESHAR